jgi:hypothetical protein
MHTTGCREKVDAMKRILIVAAALLACCRLGLPVEIVDLFPEKPGTLTCWTETGSEPRPTRTHFLKVALGSGVLEVLALPGEDPDGEGPAESRLTPPEELFDRFQALAAVNANAFASLESGTSAYPNWHAGQPVDVHGLAASRGKRISPVEKGRTPFWLDRQQRPHIGNPAEGDRVMEAVSDWFSPLLASSRIMADASDRALHPRTALGFDDSGRWLLMVVVDGRQPGFSEGVTLYELADILLAQGCSQSINLDGGGSSILLIREPGGEIRTWNSPSGAEHRPIPVMLGVRRRVP